ncbi:hypothetical protein REPUB_Repub20aG0080300 [Reevesia pubescens]
MWWLLRPYDQLFLFLILCFLNFQPNLSSSSSPTTRLCSQDEAVALIQFNSSFFVDEMASRNYDDASIKSYPKINSWKEGTNCYTWDGVTCHNIKGQVIGLDLSCSWLYGSFLSNSSLFYLPHLQRLNLTVNDFNNSKMSYDFGSLSLNSNGTSAADYTLLNLTSLDFSSCNVHEFPKFLEGTKILQVLDLSNNRIYGEIPNLMWDVGKDSLAYLNLSHNSLTKVEQLLWKELSAIDLSSSLIHGDLPSPPLTTIVFLISNNSLIGEISYLICNASSLELLDLSLIT